MASTQPLRTQPLSTHAVPTPASGTVGLLVQLKLRLLRNGLTRSVWKIVGLVVGGLYGLFVVAMAWLGFGALRFAAPEYIGPVTVVVFALISIGWVIFSTLVFGIDDTLNPARFALLPLSARRLRPGLLVAGLLGIPGLATVLVALALILVWSTSVITVLLAVVAIPIGIVSAFLLSRLATSAFADALSSRRFRDAAVVLLALSGAGLGLGINVAIQSAQNNTAGFTVLLDQVAAVLGWTPFGWAWSLPAAAARGAWLELVVKAVLALALVWVCWRGWGHFLERRLTSPLTARSGEGRVRSGGRLDQLLPATPTGAIAARSLRYWRRDPRHLAGLAALIVLPAMLLVLNLIQPDGSTLVMAFAPAAFALLLGSVVGMELAYDGSAIALHIVSGVRGRDDRAGRLLAAGIVFGPLLVALIAVSLAVSGRWDLTASVLIVVLATAVNVMGFASWLSTWWPGHAPPPEANPFGKGSSGGLESLIQLSVVTLVGLIATLPTIAAVVGALWYPWLIAVAAVLAVVIGAIAIRVGVVVGGRSLDRRWPEVLKSVTALDA